jgi:hypothetical protein
MCVPMNETKVIIVKSHYKLELHIVAHCQWWKKINFVKIKFQLNENIEWHCMQLELNSNSNREKWDANWLKIYLKSFYIMATCLNNM